MAQRVSHVRLENNQLEIAQNVKIVKWDGSGKVACVTTHARP
jgi:hypothetical protein